MPKRLYFHELAKKLGIPGAEFPPNPGQSPPPQSAGPMVHPNVWGQQGGEKLLAYLKANYGPGDTLEYDGHADCWLMLAMLDQMRECHLCTYIGAGFDRVLSITSYRTGKAPAQKQPCTFQTVEHGDDILLTVWPEARRNTLCSPLMDTLHRRFWLERIYSSDWRGGICCLPFLFL